MGRPTKRTPEMIDVLLDRLVKADGGLEEVCAADDMPSAGTVHRWVREDGEFRQAYMRARDMSGEVQAHRAVGEALNAEDAALGRLRYDARKWIAGKLSPRYGDKLALTGSDGGAMETKHVIEFVQGPPVKITGTKLIKGPKE